MARISYSQWIWVSQLIMFNVVYWHFVTENNDKSDADAAAAAADDDYDDDVDGDDELSNTTNTLSVL